MKNDLDARIRVHLAARTDKYGSCAGCEIDCGCQNCTAVDDAVLAVLDRHKPVEIGDLDRPTYICGECYFHNEYPCPTVQDIATELGIEIE